MKVKILLIVGLVLCLTAPPAAQATSIAISNFNADEIFESSSPSFAPNDVDATGGSNNGYWAETGYSGIGSATGLPVDGSFTSATGSGVKYQLQPYTGNNALRLDSLTSSGNLDVTDGQYVQLHILATSGNAGASNTSDITLKFSDSTTSTYINKLNAPDWYDLSGNATAAITGLTRVAPSTPSPFAMYETVLSLTAEDQLKTLMSIDFNLASGARVTSIYAVDGTAAVPLPGALILLGTGLVWLAAHTPKKRTLA